MREGTPGLILSLLPLSPSHCLFLPSLSFFQDFSSLSPLLLFPSHCSIPPSLSLQAVMWLHLIAVEINKASKFVFLLRRVTQRKRDLLRVVQSFRRGAPSQSHAQAAGRTSFIILHCMFVVLSSYKPDFLFLQSHHCSIS